MPCAALALLTLTPPPTLTLTPSSSAFCGKLRCNAKGTEFAIYDDSNDPYGLKTGKPRRELGIISFKRKLMGPLTLEVVMP